MLGFPVPPNHLFPKDSESFAEARILAVERLAEEQRRRLKELQAGHVALESELRTLRAQRRETLERPPSRIADAKGDAALDRWADRPQAPYTPMLRRAISAAAIPSTRTDNAFPPPAGAPKMEIEERLTPKKKPFAPVWPTAQGLEMDSCTPEKLSAADVQVRSASPDENDQIVNTEMDGKLHAFQKDNARGAIFPVRTGKRHRHIPVPDHIFGGLGDDGRDWCQEKGWLGMGRKHFPEKVEHRIKGGAPDEMASTMPVYKAHYVGAKDHWHIGKEVTDAPACLGRRHVTPPKASLFASRVEASSPSDARPQSAKPVGGKDRIRAGTCEDDGKHPQGRRYFEVIDHVSAGMSFDDPPGSHGHNKDDMFQDGLPRGIGRGKHHIDMKEHLLGACPVKDSEPGLHGHSRDDDFEGGLERGIGHGKRHVESGLEVFIAEAAKSPPPVRPAAAPWMEEPSTSPAGLPSRYCAMPNPGELPRPRMW